MVADLNLSGIAKKLVSLRFALHPAALAEIQDIAEAHLLRVPLVLVTVPEAADRVALVLGVNPVVGAGELHAAGSDAAQLPDAGVVEHVVVPDAVLLAQVALARLHRGAPRAAHLLRLLVPVAVVNTVLNPGEEAVALDHNVVTAVNAGLASAPTRAEGVLVVVPLVPLVPLGVEVGSVETHVPGAVILGHVALHTVVQLAAPELTALPALPVAACGVVVALLPAANAPAGDDLRLLLQYARLPLALPGALIHCLADVLVGLTAVRVAVVVLEVVGNWEALLKLAVAAAHDTVVLFLALLHVLLAVELLAGVVEVGVVVLARLPVLGIVNVAAESLLTLVSVEGVARGSGRARTRHLHPVVHTRAAPLTAVPFLALAALLRRVVKVITKVTVLCEP